MNKASYGLCCIDAFSKKADVQLMKKRNKEETVEAMVVVLQRMGFPHSIYCDEGSEFNNSAFKELCDDIDAQLIFTIRHAPIVERFNRTLKEMLHKYLQSTGTKTIVNVLPKIVGNYNKSYHTAIGMAPNEVNDHTEHIVQINLLKNLTPNPYTKLKVGDLFRVQVKPQSFVKGYKPKFSKTIYEITEKGNGYYKTTKGDRLYLKSNLQKVDSYEINPEKPDLEGTREGHLRELHSRPREEREENVEEESVRRPTRERRPVSYVEDSKKGRITY
ncbi:MAG: hypothetical protein P4M14_09930 [Gammaproteobacteria bacterium]|nr:hypothetical protein [Gammaproteobacteria bacterium]